MSTILQFKKKKNIGRGQLDWVFKCILELQELKQFGSKKGFK